MYSEYTAMSIKSIPTDPDSSDVPRVEKKISRALRNVDFGLRIEKTGKLWGRSGIIFGLAYLTLLLYHFYRGCQAKRK